ncbi:MAG: hypothetical protein DBX49_05305 [Clostridia bacterium]|nr:MAG: hypothetical protein DBX49_05305 [Clostridia bacterium]
MSRPSIIFVSESAARWERPACQESPAGLSGTLRQRRILREKITAKNPPCRSEAFSARRFDFCRVRRALRGPPPGFIGSLIG